MDEKMNEFLKVEYEKCLDLLKYYDERHLSLMKYAVGASSSVVSLIFAFNALGGSTNSYFWQFASILAGVTAIGLLTLFVAMLQNRLYFVYPARQVNAIRGAMVGRVSEIFSNNQMYVTTDVRAFRLLSLHTLMNLLVAMHIGAFAGFSWFCVVVTSEDVNLSIKAAVGMAVFISLLLFVLSSLYLYKRGGQNADRAIHSIKESSK